MTPTDRQWRGPRREHRVVEIPIPPNDRPDLDLSGHEGWHVVAMLAHRLDDHGARVEVVLMERDVEP